MIKVIGICLVIGASSGIGYLMSLSLTKRHQQLKTIRRLLLFLKGEISYGKSTLPEALDQIGQKLPEPFHLFLTEVARKACQYDGRTFQELFAEGVDEHLSSSSLTPKDKESLKQIGQYLGYLDIAMQISTLELYQQELELELKEIEATIPAKKRIYQSLGVMGGLFLAIALA